MSHLERVLRDRKARLRQKPRLPQRDVFTRDDIRVSWRRATNVVRRHRLDDGCVLSALDADEWAGVYASCRGDHPTSWRRESESESLKKCKLYYARRYSRGNILCSLCRGGVLRQRAEDFVRKPSGEWLCRHCAAWQTAVAAGRHPLTTAWRAKAAALAARDPRQDLEVFPSTSADWKAMRVDDYATPVPWAPLPYRCPTIPAALLRAASL